MMVDRSQRRGGAAFVVGGFGVGDKNFVRFCSEMEVAGTTALINATQTLRREPNQAMSPGSGQAVDYHLVPGLDRQSRYEAGDVPPDVNFLKENLASNAVMVVRTMFPLRLSGY